MVISGDKISQYFHILGWLFVKVFYNTADSHFNLLLKYDLMIDFFKIYNAVLKEREYIHIFYMKIHLHCTLPFSTT